MIIPRETHSEARLDDAAPKPTHPRRGKDIQAHVSGQKGSLYLWSPAGPSDCWLHFTLLQLFWLLRQIKIAGVEPSCSCLRLLPTPALTPEGLTLEPGMKQ